jgi:hypothetical protein
MPRKPTKNIWLKDDAGQIVSAKIVYDTHSCDPRNPYLCLVTSNGHTVYRYQSQLEIQVQL